MNNSKTLNIVRGGIFTALGLALMYIASIMPTNRLFFAAASSIVIVAAIVQIGVRWSVLVFISTAILSIFIPGPKFLNISYICFFGVYGIIKYFIEGLRKLPLELLLKLAFFNAALAAGVFIYKLLFMYFPQLNYSLIFIFICAQAVFLVYDYALTLIIHSIEKYLRK